MTKYYAFAFLAFIVGVLLFATIYVLLGGTAQSLGYGTKGLVMLILLGVSWSIVQYGKKKTGISDSDEAD
jgi:hypothetical protein